MGSLHNVVLHMESLMMHDHYGASIHLLGLCDTFVDRHVWAAVGEHKTIKICTPLSTWNLRVKPFVPYYVHTMMCVHLISGRA